MTPPYNCITNVLATANVDTWYPSTVAPVVADDTARNALFPSPATDQRVQNLGSGQYERWDGSAWISDIPIDPSLVLGENRTVTEMAEYLNNNAVYNVKDYGATGNGSTNDIPTIQQALDACSAAGGGVVYIPRGIYLLDPVAPMDQYLAVGPNTVLRGDGQTLSILKVGDLAGDYIEIIGSNPMTSNISSFICTGITIDSNSTGNPVTNITVLETTKPRISMRLVANGGPIIIQNTGFHDTDNINTLYFVSKYAEVSHCRFTLDGGSATPSDSHDHSAIYITADEQIITGNTMEAVAGSSGGITAIETHGGRQTVTHNIIRDYFTGANLTGVASTRYTIGVTCANNVITGCVNGVHLWAYYLGSITTGVTFSNLTITGNAIEIDRDQWADVPNLTAYGQGILFDSNNTSPMENITIVGNTIHYLPVTGTIPANDYNSCAIDFNLSNAAAEITNFILADNTINNPLSAGFRFAGSGVFRRGQIRNNIIVNPASTPQTIAAGFRSGFCLIASVFDDIKFEDNTIHDTRTPHVTEYGMYLSSGVTSVAHCSTRNTRVICTDGTVLPPVQSIFTAGRELFITETMDTYAAPTGAFKSGSSVMDLSTGVRYIQVSAPSGFNWLPLQNQGVSTDRGDANVTLTLADSPIQLFETALTVNRTCAVPSITGAQWDVVRTGTGAGTLGVAGVKTIPAYAKASVTVARGLVNKLVNYTPLAFDGVWHGSAALDFPSINAQSFQDLTITVNGAATATDRVIMGLPSTIDGGLVFNAFVSAANTITVRATNVTGSAIDPASMTFLVTVVRPFT